MGGFARIRNALDEHRAAGNVTALPANRKQLNELFTANLLAAGLGPRSTGSALHREQRRSVSVQAVPASNPTGRILTMRSRDERDGDFDDPKGDPLPAAEKSTSSSSIPFRLRDLRMIAEMPN